MNKDKVTIHDVARAANVSAATVSRVLNNSDHPVKPELKEKILLASKQLGYIPNLQARNLKSKKVHPSGSSFRLLRTHFIRLLYGESKMRSSAGITICPYRAVTETKNVLITALKICWQ